MSTESRQRKAAWEQARDDLAERREEAQRLADQLDREEAAGVRAKQRFLDGLTDEPDGRSLGEILAAVRDAPPPRDPDAPPRPLLGLPGRPAPVDPVENARARQRARRARAEDAARLARLDAERAAYLATTADAGLRHSGLSYGFYRLYAAPRQWPA